MVDSPKARIAFIEAGNQLLDFAKIAAVSTHAEETLLPSVTPWAFEPQKLIRYFPSFVTTSGAHVPVFDEGLSQTHLKYAMTEAARVLSAPNYKEPAVVRIKPTRRKTVKVSAISLSRYRRELKR